MAPRQTRPSSDIIQIPPLPSVTQPNGLDKLFYFLTEFKEVNLEYLHIDIMDGLFVPNFALGTDYVKSLRRITDIPFDAGRRNSVLAGESISVHIVSLDSFVHIPAFSVSRVNPTSTDLEMLMLVSNG